MNKVTMKIFEKYKKLFNACRKYPEITLSKRLGSTLPVNSNYSTQYRINNNKKLISSPEEKCM